MTPDHSASPPLLTLKDFCLTFLADKELGGNTPVLHDVNLKVCQGTTHALVGESGSGKSVTALAIMRLLEETNQIEVRGSITFAGQDVLAMAPPQVRAMRGNRIAMIFQEPMTSLNPVYTIGNQLMEPLLLHQGLDREQARKRALALLKRCGIKDPEYRINAYPHQLSGGQRQRVMIAMALACRPQLLIADEPTTALDVTIQQQILALIQDIQQEYQMGVLLITHDLAMVEQVASQVSIMHNGRIVEQGSTATIFANPRNPYTVHLLNAVPRGGHVARPGSDILVQLEEISCHFTMSSGWHGFFRRTTKTIKAVDKVSTTVRAGTTLGVVGESGSGKSTLALCLLRLLPCGGRIWYQNNGMKVQLLSLNNRQMRPLRRHLQIVFQDPFSSLSPRLTIGQIIGEGLRVHRIGATRRERQQLVAQAMEEVEIDPNLAQRYPHEFSGGQRQRIAIARAIILKPRLLILDEPTSALDMTIQAQIIDLLQTLQAKHQLTYIFITHDLRVVRTLADTLLVMQHGRVVEQGIAADIFAAPQQPYTQQLFSAAFHNNYEKIKTY